MDQEKPLVTNASNRKQVNNAKDKKKLQRYNELQDLRLMMGLPEGRRVLWRILSECGVFHSIWHPSAKIHYNAGQQDLGHFLFAEAGAASEELLFKMMVENKKEGENNVN